MSFVLFPLMALLSERKKWAILCQFPILLGKYYYSTEFKGRDLPVHTIWPEIPASLIWIMHTGNALSSESHWKAHMFPEKNLGVPQGSFSQHTKTA